MCAPVEGALIKLSQASADAPTVGRSRTATQMPKIYPIQNTYPPRLPITD